MNLLKSFYCFLRDIFSSKEMLWGLSKNDLKSRFASSLLGIVWAFIQPLTTIFVFWFVFEMGFKNPPVNDIPFILWFIPAFLVWNFFSESLSAGCNCLREYSYLVKKVNFRVSIVPIVKIMSSAYVHIFFIFFIFFMYGCYGRYPTVYNVQIIYYFICTATLLLGICWLFSAITAFVPDMSSIVNVMIQVGFWLTPIFWDIETMNQPYATILKLNPMFYICRGYRDCFIGENWFWNYGGTTVYFWVVTLVVFCLGALVFKRLRPHFADVL